MNYTNVTEGYDNVPTMDIHAVKANLLQCARHDFGHCDGCKYLGSKNCQSRLMYEASHALHLLLDEHDHGIKCSVTPAPQD